MLLEDSSSPNREGSSSVWCSWGALKIQVLVLCVYMSHLSSEFSTITTNTVVITLGKKKILLLTGAPLVPPPIFVFPRIYHHWLQLKITTFSPSHTTGM